MLPLPLLMILTYVSMICSSVCGMQAVEEACSSSDAARRFVVLYGGAAKQGELVCSVNACWPWQRRKHCSLLPLSVQHVSKGSTVAAIP
jgi:hypothetical protein